MLRVEELQVSVGDHLLAVRDVSFRIGRGESVGLVGESGSGKTITCRSVLGLLPGTGEVDHGLIRLGSGADEVELTRARRSTWNQIRGTRVAAVFQDPASYLNPSLTVGHQVDEVLRVRGGLGRRAARERTLELLVEVGLHDAERVYHCYPFELSGGMLQRVIIAIAISLNPELLIADEATTALDTVVQAEILELLQRLRRTHQLSLLLVTHDLAVVAETCDRVLVMYAGEIVESGPTEQGLGDPQHPYTQALMSVASIGDWSPPPPGPIPGPAPAGGGGEPRWRVPPGLPFRRPGGGRRSVPLAPVDRDRASRCVR